MNTKDVNKLTEIVKEVRAIADIVDSCFYFNRVILEAETSIFLLFPDRLECANFGPLGKDRPKVLVWDIKKEEWKGKQ